MVDSEEVKKQCSLHSNNTLYTQKYKMMNALYTVYTLKQVEFNSN